MAQICLKQTDSLGSEAVSNWAWGNTYLWETHLTERPWSPRPISPSVVWAVAWTHQRGLIFKNASFWTRQFEIQPYWPAPRLHSSLNAGQEAALRAGRLMKFLLKGRQRTLYRDLCFLGPISLWKPDRVTAYWQADPDLQFFNFPHPHVHLTAAAFGHHVL